MREALKDEIAHELSEAVVNVIRRMGAGRGLAEGQRAVRRGMDAATRYAGDVAEDASEQSRRLIRYANRELRDHPIAAFGAGLALGALVGMLIAHRSETTIES